MTTAEHTIVMLLDEDNRELRGKAIGTKIGAQSPHRQPDEITVSPDWRGMRQAMETEQFLLLDNLKSDWDNAGTLGHLFKEHKVPACLIVPIVQHEVPGGSPGNGRPLGILIAYSDGRIPFEQHAISQPVSQLQGIAGQAATNISNALMHEALTRSYEERVMLDKLKDEFILTISHEFRTPLTAVSGFISIVRRIVRQHSDQMDEQKLTEFTEEIQRASNQIVGLVTMLSDASRMPSQALQLGRKHTMLWQQADVAVHGFTPELRQRISSNVSPDIAVFADEDRLQIVFTNLVSNALRYTKGPVEITAREASRASLAQAKRYGTAEPSAPERWIVASVRDHGQGIPEADRERIFDKFVRLERSLTSDVRGTGLGLWICREYLRAMGGDIWVTNAPGGGADFQLALPVSLTAPEP
jgi:signal transduction histidine kinase